MITTTDGKIFLIILFKFDEIEQMQIKEEQAEKQQNEISKQEQLAKFSRQGNQSVK